MEYQETMQTLSQCGLGALVMEADSRIVAVNQIGDTLLHGDGQLEGKLLSEIALPLSMESEKPIYANIVFGEYLLRCPTPKVENLPSGTQFVVFRNATAQAMQDILLHVVNQLSEALFVCDAESRILFLNDAGIRMESMDCGTFAVSAQRMSIRCGMAAKTMCRKSFARASRSSITDSIIPRDTEKM